MNDGDRQEVMRHVVVPDLHDTAGLFVPEPERARLIAKYSAPLPETAGMTARRLTQEAATPIVIHGCSNDLRACRVLQSELERFDLRAEIALAHEEHGEAPATRCILNIESVLGGDAIALAALAERCRKSVKEHGSSSVRMQTPAQAVSDGEPGMRASPLPASLGLRNRAWRELLLALVAEHWPNKIAAWISLLQAEALAVNPIESVYAGQNLRDRNRDLLVNIL